MTVYYNKIRIISVITFVFIAGFISTAKGGVPLDAPEIVDMKIVGAMGDVYNDITNDLMLNGNYLYCAMSQNGGLRTLNVSDPTNMILTSEWHDGTGGGGQTHGLARKGTVLYMTNWSPHIGLRVFNISDPAHPLLIHTIATTTSSWDITADGDLLFITVSNGFNVYGIDIFDTSIPSSLKRLTFFQTPSRALGQVARYGNYMYLPMRNWLYVYNITDPVNPAFVRELTFNANTGGAPTRIYNGYLYMAAGYSIENNWMDGGLYIFSLTDPSNPQQVGPFYPRSTCKDLDVQHSGRYAIIPTGGNGVLALDVSNPSNILGLWQAEMEWPDTGPGGYEDAAAGVGDYVFIGTDTPGGCTEYCGGRVYAVRLETPMPPIIAEVTPDPDVACIGKAYSKQLSLLQGTPLPTWSVVQAPGGTLVDNNGLVSGWIPNPVDIVGGPFIFEIRATNEDGQDTEGWQVIVKSIANFDNDNDVDQEDFGWFQTCYTGSGVFPTTECEPADLDSDRDVDVEDFAIFQTCMGGPDDPPGC
ncbi:MAG: hypothetical protein JSV03_03820 [Planctomycetota bacterium]|nr:MAG: hypothetical protein JSV03_03820 [Planctomycetota bacterium]